MRLGKLLVLIVLIVLICSSLITSCDDEVIETLSPTPNKNIAPSSKPTVEPLGLPDEVQLVECQFYNSHSTEDKERKENWVHLISDKYGVKLTVIEPAQSSYMNPINSAAQSGDLNGIVELFGTPYFLDWKDKGLIYPLSDFLSDNEVWNTVIPDTWKAAYTIDGEIWAIPSGSDDWPSWFTRVIRGDWLDKFDLTKPYNVNEFYEASYKFTYGDPDGNDINDTVGFTSSGTWNMQDIFQAFDARLNYIGEVKPIWNPNTGIWEDSMVKPEMIECLEFLNKCFSEGILDNECFSEIGGSGIRERISSGLYGGTCYWDSYLFIFEDSITEKIPEAYLLSLGALSHTIDINLNHYTIPIGSSRVLMKTTPQPKETINWFVNTFYGEEWGFWTARLGPVGEYRGQEDYACTIDGNTIIRNTYIDATGTIKTYPSPGYITGLPSKAMYTVYEIAYYVSDPPESFESWTTDTAKIEKDNAYKRKAWIDEYVDNGMAYLLPENLKESASELYFKIGGDIDLAGQNAIKSAITGEMSIEDALAHYRKIAIELGVQEILDYENTQLGQISNQHY